MTYLALNVMDTLTVEPVKLVPCWALFPAYQHHVVRHKSYNIIMEYLIHYIKQDFNDTRTNSNKIEELFLKVEHIDWEREREMEGLNTY